MATPRDNDDKKRSSNVEPVSDETRPMTPDEMKEFEESFVQGEGERPEDRATPIRPPSRPGRDAPAAASLNPCAERGRTVDKHDPF
jgi:hypothetical protein